MSNLNAERKLSSCDAVKHDAFKPPLGLIPKSALDEEAAVLGFGAEKYDVHNWRRGMPWSRLISAAMRHLVDFNAGQDFDKESGLHALAHVRACCGFLIEYMTTHPELDDRFKRPETVVPIATVAQLEECVKNNVPISTAAQLEEWVKNKRVLDVGQSKSPPWSKK